MENQSDSDEEMKLTGWMWLFWSSLVGWAAIVDGVEDLILILRVD